MTLRVCQAAVASTSRSSRNAHHASAALRNELSIRWVSEVDDVEGVACPLAVLDIDARGAPRTRHHDH